MSSVPAIKYSTRLRPVRRGGGLWIIAGMGDPVRTEGFVASSDTLYLRAFDGREVMLGGDVVIPPPAKERARGFSALLPRGRASEPAPSRPEIRSKGWHPLGENTARSPDGSIVAELMELLAVSRPNAPAWFMKIISAARAEREDSVGSGSFYEGLVARGVAASTSMGLWGTCDFQEWKYRSAARLMDDWAIKLFAIHCTPVDTLDRGDMTMGAPDIIGLCETVAPAAYFVSVRKSSVSREGDRVGLDLEVEAGRVPPADWTSPSVSGPTRFEIAASVGAKGSSTLVVPEGERSGVQSLHFDVPRGNKTVRVTVYDDHKRRYDLPIDIS